ncbi:hypothetical protein HAX54_003927, partial [Datura stramonium]|nr:hypothetical protein [Datura stramonium]
LGIQTPRQLITLVLYVLEAQPLAIEFPKVRVHHYRFTRVFRRGLAGARRSARARDPMASIIIMVLMAWDKFPMGSLFGLLGIEVMLVIQ